MKKKEFNTVRILLTHDLTIWTSWNEIPPNQTIKINCSLTVDLDGTFWASCSHFIGGFDGKFTSWGTIGTGNDEGIKSIRILGDFEAGTLGDIGLTFPPGNGRSWQAVDLSFQYKLFGRKKYVSKLYLNSKLHNINHQWNMD